MIDTLTDFRAIHQHKRALRAKYGVACPICKLTRSATDPTILLPGARCGNDGYVDERSELTAEQWRNA
jgi:hypothetical protein